MNIQFKRRFMMVGTFVLLVGTNAFSDLQNDPFLNFGHSVSGYYDQSWNYENQTPTLAPAQARTYSLTQKNYQDWHQATAPKPLTGDVMPTTDASVSSVAPARAKTSSGAAQIASGSAESAQGIYETALTQRHNELQTAALTACVTGAVNVNSSCAYAAGGATNAALQSRPVLAQPLVAGSCSPQRVSVPGTHQYGSEFMEKIVSAPNANPPALFGISADLSSAAEKLGQAAMHISKSVDGGKTWVEVSKIPSDDYSISDGLYDGLGVSADGKNIAFSTRKGVFVPNPNGDPKNPFTKLSPADDSQPAATDVQISPDGKHMAASYGFFDQKATVVTYHLENGAWKKDMIAPITSGSNVISLQYDPSGKLYAGTGNQVFSFNTDSNKWNQIPISIAKTTKTKSGKTVTTKKLVNDVSVYGMTFTPSGTPPNQTYTPTLAATCWGVFNLPAQSLSKGRTYSVVANPKNPMQVVKTTAMGASFSTDGGNTWNSIAGLPECESTVTPGLMITQTSSAACADAWNVKTGKTPASQVIKGTHGEKDKVVWHAKVDPNIYPSEFRTAQFNADGTLLVSGTSGTFLANPFATACK